jgi:hypothetical protein
MQCLGPSGPFFVQKKKQVTMRRNYLDRDEARGVVGPPTWERGKQMGESDSASDVIQ